MADPEWDAIAAQHLAAAIREGSGPAPDRCDTCRVGLNILDLIANRAGLPAVASTDTEEER